MADAMDNLDVVIELSAQLDAEWAKAFVARGGRIGCVAREVFGR